MKGACPITTQTASREDTRPDVVKRSFIPRKTEKSSNGRKQDTPLETKPRTIQMVSGNVAIERSQLAHLQDCMDPRVRRLLENKAPQGSLVIVRVA